MPPLDGCGVALGVRIGFAGCTMVLCHVSSSSMRRGGVIRSLDLRRREGSDPEKCTLRAMPCLA